ncbi:unnamed protein product [Rhodiola kirilowii]
MWHDEKSNWGENNIPSSFKQSKKLVADLGMGYQRIDVCVGGCMIYYGCDESMTRHFLSQSLASEMCWHATHGAEVHRMVHPSDWESWKHFDQ